MKRQVVILGLWMQGVAWAAEPIKDNSFFIEEAYNQEAGVVQHIFNVNSFALPSRTTAFTFTQEWPVGSLLHQASVTAPYLALDAGPASGIGDLLLNYRYQWMDGQTGVAVAPRLSVLVPTGDQLKGLGFGSFGLQVNMPVSIELHEHLVSHLNAGATWIPSAKGQDAGGNPITRTLWSWSIGGSLIVLLHENVNALVEVVSVFSDSIGASGVVVNANDTIVSPGIRAAINVGSLQIVPGVAIPFSFPSTGSRTGVLVYLSLEHPF